MALGLAPDSPEQSQPDVAKRSVFRQHEVLPEFDAGATTGDLLPWLRLA